MLVLDTSVAARWFLLDEPGSESDALLHRVASDGACVPGVFQWEVQNAFLKAERTGRITPEDVDAALEVLNDLPIVVEPCGDRMFSETELRLARYYSLSAYDAAYLTLAFARRLPLATLDEALRTAA